MLRKDFSVNPSEFDEDDVRNAEPVSVSHFASSGRLLAVGCRRPNRVLVGNLIRDLVNEMNRYVRVSVESS